ncbi:MULTISPECIES: hypothetical protein [unclassified Luteococcus]|uniref:hypothetical protein n=1 Tax=unclassified Luteococcus TaxID=2639923 RepID=UPI00313DB0AF
MENDETFDLIGYVTGLKRFLVPAALVGLVTMIAVSLLGMRGGPVSAPEEHAAKAHVMVQPKASETAMSNPQVELLPQLMRTFVALEDVPLFTEAVSKKLGGTPTSDEVRDRCTIFWGGGSLLLAINAKAPSEEEALKLGQACAEELVELAPQIIKEPKAEMPTLVLVEDAKTVTQTDDGTMTAPSRFAGVRNGIAAGLVAALLAAVVLDWRSARRRNKSAA